MPKSNQYDEAKILAGCRQNDRRAQRKLYNKHFPVMMSMCMRHTRDEQKAMEIVNNGFLKVFKNIEQYADKGSLQGWIRKIVYRSISDYFRAHRDQLYYLETEQPKQGPGSHQDALEKLYYEDILRSLEALPARSAEVFKSYILEGYTHKEIADKLGISIGTSKWHVSHARQQLKSMIKSNIG